MFKCSVCKDVMIDPLLQTCGHSICQDCRDGLLDTKCPECRQVCTAYTPNLIVKQHNWSVYPKACRKKQHKINGGWSVLEKAPGCSNLLKRKLIDYIDRSRSNPATSNKRLACPAPSNASLSAWNGYISVRLDPAVTLPTDIRLSGPSAHVFKLAMVKDRELFLAFGPPVVAGSRGRNHAAPMAYDSDDDDLE